MRKPLSSLLCSALIPLGAALPAQTETSPKGFLNVEANSSQTELFSVGGSIYRTFSRQVDGTLVGIPARSIGTLRLRRDGSSASNTTAGARTVKVSARLAHGDFAKVASAVDQADSDWLASPWALVMDEKTVAL